jgi:hypothetical protein
MLVVLQAEIKVRDLTTMEEQFKNNLAAGHKHSSSGKFSMGGLGGCFNCFSPDQDSAARYH